MRRGNPVIPTVQSAASRSAYLGKRTAKRVLSRRLKMPHWRQRQQVHRAIMALATGYRSRRLLLTTVKLESAMAPEASIGESRPRAATGTPKVL